MNFRPIRTGFTSVSWRAAKFAGALLVCAAAAGAGTSFQHHKPTPKQQSAPPDAPVPFHSGEQLSFRVLWSKFSVNAALVKMSVLERRDFFGHAAWHFRGQAQTVETTRMLYPLDDEFDSYTDASQLSSLQYEIYLHEQGKQQNNMWRMSTQNEPAPRDTPVARVAPGTRDPIGVLYALRAVDWTHVPEFRAPVFDGVHLYDIVARLSSASEPISVPAGNFKASRIDIRAFQHGQEVNDLRISLWLSQDAARTPVLIEAVAPAPIGTVRAELTGTP